MTANGQQSGLQRLEWETARAITAQQLCQPGEKGLLLVSGGSDSMALLRLMAALAGRLELSLEVVHFDHGLRAESAGEAQWVAAQAQGLGLVCHLERARHLAGLSSGLQAAARGWRRERTAQLLESRGAAWAATGHQRQDSLETQLMKLLRGAYLSHLQGLAWRSGLTVRPLLAFSRERLRRYLEALGQPWLEDPSNLLPHYKRNRVRHQLMPLLESLTGGGLAARLDNLALQSGWCADWLETTPPPAEGVSGEGRWLALEGLLVLPRLARLHHLHRWVGGGRPVKLDFGHLEAAERLLQEGAPHWRLNLPQGRLLQRKRERLWLKGE